ncbi:hypothetical protein GM418_10130 [Maribellus comscasis]|uniref:Uncharacterized protein n=1 Tax=Maribellus comscasis TaxID=2681766 RepID=A0A6I6JSC8_9BACT|nr:hypothetical protein [Maribellus comscasis]QGY44000.1 hypothetical protein GM418_10130 [Maribellus comscasis]
MNAKTFTVLFIIVLYTLACSTDSNQLVLLDEDFSTLPHGPLGTDVGAHTEYHYIAEARAQTRWAISTFRYNLPPSWEIRKNGDGQMLFQNAINPDKHWHPMVVTGSEFWNDYTLEVEFKPLELKRRNGVVFRYQNDRCYYFAGVENHSAKIIKVQNGKAFQVPNEVVLATAEFYTLEDGTIHLKIDLDSDNIKCVVNDSISLSVKNSSFEIGKVGLLSDSPTAFYSVKISSSEADFQKYKNEESRFQQIQDSLIAENPKMKVFKKIQLEDFGTGRNVRFGDLNGDDKTDILLGQVVNHGPKDRNSELSCLTAVTLNGDLLWQKGSPDPWKTKLTSDVAFQIHDVNNDGKNEVIYCMNQELIVAEGATGKVLQKISTPLSPSGKPLPSGHNIFPRILGDCLYFCDLEGNGFDSNIILKDRYNYIWAYDANLKQLWQNECRTGHYPFAYDTDNDGKDEIVSGYTLFDENGTKLWSLDDVLEDHADGVAIVQLKESESPVFVCAASDEGIFFADTDGNILKHHYFGHIQNPAVANFRDDLPGLETVSVNFWGNQGIMNLFNSSGELYHTFEPTQYGSMCLPLNWTGKTEEFYILNANTSEGGAWDGYGRKVLEFPDDGHPDMSYAVVDVTGDCRDEIVVWNPNELWVYTQEDNPLNNENLYKPVRNPLYNYSNYQATVSIAE